MSATKPRSDSVLKTLPEERQRSVIDYLQAHSLAETKKWLKDDGLRTSTAALSEFWSWWQLRDRLRRNESTVNQLLDDLRREQPDLDDAKIFAAGQRFFAALAIEQQDARDWKRTQDIALKKQLIGLERQKFQRETCELFLRWAEDRRAKEIASSKASNAEKISQLGQLMFGEDFQ